MSNEWKRLTPEGTKGIPVFVSSIFGHAYYLAVGFSQQALTVETGSWLCLTTPEAIAFAAQLPEVQALVEDLREARRICRNQKALYESLGDPCADEWGQLVARFDSHIAPFEEARDE